MGTASVPVLPALLTVAALLAVAVAFAIGLRRGRRSRHRPGQACTDQIPTRIITAPLQVIYLPHIQVEEPPADTQPVGLRLIR